MRRAILTLSTAVASGVLVVGIGMTASGGTTPECELHVPAGSTERAAERVVELLTKPAAPGEARSGCRDRLFVPALRGSGLPRYRTRRPDQLVGWFQLAPRIVNDRGLWEYAAFLWLGAPDAPPAAFELLLELHEGRWLVSAVRRVPGAAGVDASAYPT